MTAPRRIVLYLAVLCQSESQAADVGPGCVPCACMGDLSASYRQLGKRGMGREEESSTFFVIVLLSKWPSQKTFLNLNA